MKKIAAAIVTAGFAAAVFSAPVLAASHAKKKAAPGKCGVMMYFDTKSKSCKSKG